MVSYLPFTTLVYSLEFTFKDAMSFKKIVTFDSIKNELIEACGYKLNHDGTVLIE